MEKEELSDELSDDNDLLRNDLIKKDLPGLIFHFNETTYLNLCQMNDLIYAVTHTGTRDRFLGSGP